MTKVAGYGRMSTDKQQESPKVQEQHIRNWFRQQKETNGIPADATFVGMFVDEAVSSRVHMLDREAGQHLLTLLDPGDIVVVSKYNRAFRSAADAERTLEAFDTAGIRLKFLDMQVDHTNANGKLVSGLMAVVSKHERDLRSETTREALKHRMRTRGYACGKPPIGWMFGYRKRKGRGKRKAEVKIVPDNDWRLYCNAARRLLRSGMSRPVANRTLVPYMIKYDLPGGTSQSKMVDAAGAACLNFPTCGIALASKLLGVSVGTISFVCRDDHDELIIKLNQRLVEEGYAE